VNYTAPIQLNREGYTGLLASLLGGGGGSFTLPAVQVCDFAAAGSPYWNLQELS
jgi:hypothetical protein